MREGLKGGVGEGVLEEEGAELLGTRVRDTHTQKIKIKIKKGAGPTQALTDAKWKRPTEMTCCR